MFSYNSEWAGLPWMRADVQYEKPFVGIQGCILNLPRMQGAAPEETKGRELFISACSRLAPACANDSRLRCSLRENKKKRCVWGGETVPCITPSLSDLPALTFGHKTTFRTTRTRRKNYRTTFPHTDKFNAEYKGRGKPIGGHSSLPKIFWRRVLFVAGAREPTFF